MEKTDHQFIAQYSGQDIKEAAKYIWKRKSLKRDVIISVLLVVTCAYSIFSGQEVSRGGALLACLVILTIYWGIRWRIYRKVFTKVQSQFGTLPDGKVTVTISKDFMTVSSAVGETKVLFKDVTDAWHSPRLLFLFTTGRQYIYFPVAQLSEEIKAYILEKIPRSIRG